MSRITLPASKEIAAMTSALHRMSEPHALGVTGLSARTLIGVEQHVTWATLEDVWFQPGARVPLHLHTYNEVGIAREGTVEFRVGDEVLTVAPGGVVIIPAGTPHKVHNPGQDVAHHLALASVRSDEMPAQTQVLDDPDAPPPSGTTTS
jgi:quercetin dioxygenase-like cupin family protein